MIAISRYPLSIIYILGIVIILILLIWYILYSLRQSYVNNILTGCFEANNDFLEKNNISKFTIAISPSINSSRFIYIVMLDVDEKILINEENKMILKTWNINPFSKKIQYKVILDHTIANNAIPQYMTMIYEPTSGFITLYDNDIVYAELYRNNIYSDLDGGCNQNNNTNDTNDMNDIID